MRTKLLLKSEWRGSAAVVLSTTALLTIQGLHPARAAVDPSTVPITADKLKSDAQQWPLHFVRDSLDIRRAGCSRLQKYAYDLYAGIAAKHPQDTQAQILLARAAMSYRQSLTDPMLGAMNFTPEIAREQHTLDQMVLTHLESALSDDRTGVAHTLLGWYLYNRAENCDRARAIQLLREAVRRNPDDAGFHANLASAVSQSLYPQFNPEEAEREARLALRVNPNETTVHWTLFLMYLQSNRRKDAIAQLKVYVGMLPKGAAEQSKNIPLFCRSLGISLADLTGHTETTNKQ